MKKLNEEDVGKIINILECISKLHFALGYVLFNISIISTTFFSFSFFIIYFLSHSILKSNCLIKIKLKHFPKKFLGNHSKKSKEQLLCLNRISYL